MDSRRHSYQAKVLNVIRLNRRRPEPRLRQRLVSPGWSSGRNRRLGWIRVAATLNMFDATFLNAYGCQNDSIYYFVNPDDLLSTDLVKWSMGDGLFRLHLNTVKMTRASILVVPRFDTLLGYVSYVGERHLRLPNLDIDLFYTGKKANTDSWIRVKYSKSLLSHLLRSASEPLSSSRERLVICH